VPSTPGAALEWATAYVIKSGRHNGRTLGQLDQNPEGRNLIFSLVDGWQNDINLAARMIVDAAISQ
jgi:hypothetical protein